MGYINLPSLDDITQIKDPKQQMDALLNTVGMLMKSLSEINGYLTTQNIKELHAKVIKAGTIATEKLEAGAITAEKIDVQELSAISADLGKITAGEVYGAYIATGEGVYPRAEMSSVDNFFKAMASANQYISVLPFFAGFSAPMIEFVNGVLGASVDMYINNISGKFIIDSPNNVRITSNGVALEVNGLGVTVPDWNSLRDNSTEETLQQALAAKANYSFVSKTVYVSDTSGGPANTPMTITNGVVTG